MHTDKKAGFVLSTEIDIQAPPAVVWHVLADFGAYPEWNPFIHTLTGDVKPGHRIRVLLQPPGGKAMRFSPKVLSFDKNRELSWLGSLWVRGLFDGEHRFRLTENPDGSTTLFHTEHFNGLLVPLLRKSLATDTRAGFEALNTALKERAEARMR